MSFIIAQIKSLLIFLGGLFKLLQESFYSICCGKIRRKSTFYQLRSAGVGSQIVILITGVFTGAVFAAQTYFQFKTVKMESAVGAVVSVAMCRELGPVLTGLMVSGRVGASITAEISSMKVSEQISALRAMAVHPVDYLVVPRLLAMMVAMPILVVEAVLVGILSGYLMCVYIYGVEGPWYIHHMKSYTDLNDVFISVVKGYVFGIIIVLVACYKGLNVRGGAVGVGKSTTESVVYASLLILIFNFILTLVLNIIAPLGFNS